MCGALKREIFKMEKNKFDARSISIIGLLMGLILLLTRFIVIETTDCPYWFWAFYQ